MFDTVLGAAAEAAINVDRDREWAVQRPSRSVSAIRQAVTVPAGWGPFARCVEHRESRGIPTTVNASGAAGLFQFMPAWRDSLPYVISERLGQFGMPAKARKAVRTYLFRVHYIHKYPPLYQRIAFAEVIEDGLWRHWTLPGSRCQSLVP